MIIIQWLANDMTQFLKSLKVFKSTYSLNKVIMRIG